MIRAQRRDKHNRNLIHSSKTVCVCRLSQPDHRCFRSESVTKKYVFNFFRKLICVFLERISNFCCPLRFWTMEHSSDLDHWNEVSSPFAMAEAWELSCHQNAAEIIKLLLITVKSIVGFSNLILSYKKKQRRSETFSTKPKVKSNEIKWDAVLLPLLSTGKT